MKRSNGRAPLPTVLATALVLAACALGVAAAPAAAVPGLQQRASEVPSPAIMDSNPAKTAVAFCNAGEQVIGGGGWAQEVGPLATSRRLALTALVPTDQFDGVRDAYIATAAETTPGTTNDWYVQAYAMCAPLPGAHIVNSPSSPSTAAAVKRTTVGCPSGERVLGSGGSINIAVADQGQVVLQVARPSGPGDIVRMQAHADASGFSGAWSVRAHAICAPPPPGYDVVFWESPQQASEPVKRAGFRPTDRCPGTTRLHSGGAAITDIAPGHVALQGVFPHLGGRQTRAVAVENTPLPQDRPWDFIVSTGVCAN
jgi:hypothetical protein